MIKNIKVWQLKRIAANHELFFSPLRLLEKFNDNISISNYEVVYEEDMEVNEPINDFLEELYIRFQGSKPTNYQGHSLSVSDIISVNDDFYYCDSLGFEKINI